MRNSFKILSTLVCTFFPTLISANGLPDFSVSILTGKAHNAYHSNFATIFGVETGKFNSSTDTFAGRLTAQLTPRFSLELSHHDFGQTQPSVEIRVPTVINGIVLGPESDQIYIAIPQIKLNTLKLGGKYQWSITSTLSADFRIGVAHWQYNNRTPQSITPSGLHFNDLDKGNELYYGLGLDYKLTTNLHLGLEYSYLETSHGYNVEDEKYLNELEDVSYRHRINDLSLALSWHF